MPAGADRPSYEESFQKFLKMKRMRYIKSPGYNEAKFVLSSLNPEERNFVRFEDKGEERKGLLLRKVYSTEGKPVGFADAYKFNQYSSVVAELLVAVNPEFQRKKIGSNLVRELLESCKTKGYKKILYVTSTGNKKSVDFIKKLGFKLEGSNKGTLMFVKLL